jgi:hypothetical protein
MPWAQTGRFSTASSARGKYPIALIVTGLDIEENMPDEWWWDNRGHLKSRVYVQMPQAARRKLLRGSSRVFDE